MEQRTDIFPDGSVALVEDTEKLTIAVKAGDKLPQQSKKIDKAQHKQLLKQQEQDGLVFDHRKDKFAKGGKVS